MTNERGSSRRELQSLAFECKRFRVFAEPQGRSMRCAWELEDACRTGTVDPLIKFVALREQLH